MKIKCKMHRVNCSSTFNHEEPRFLWGGPFWAPRPPPPGPALSPRGSWDYGGTLCSVPGLNWLVCEMAAAADAAHGRGQRRAELGGKDRPEREAVKHVSTRRLATEPRAFALHLRFCNRRQNDKKFREN